MAYNITHNAFSSGYCDEIEAAILESPYLGKSPLGPEFVETRGFSIVFTRNVLNDVLAEFPFLESFAARGIFPKSNAFYVNPLVMTGGSKVTPHIDCRLVATENVRILPTVVTVLYVRVDPDSRGGEFVLYPDTDDEVLVEPKSNDLLHFRGNIIHSVQALAGESTRISLVCEQYNLPSKILASFPEFDIIQDNDLAPRVPIINAR